MGRFKDYVKNFAGQAKTAYDAAGGVRGAGQKARQYGEHLTADYRQLHGNMPGASEYLNSEAGRATARFAAGSALSTFLQHKASKLGKAGTITGMAGNALFTFAHAAFQSHMSNLKHDQRIFENVAKARRGSPELEHLTHLELREISDNAKRYGGKDSEHIQKTADGELDRRQTKKNTEQAKGIKQKRDMLSADRDAHDAARHGKRMERRQEVHLARMREKEEMHKAKLARQAELRDVAGHVNAKQTAENVAKQKQSGGGGGGKPHVEKRTKKGGYVRGEGGKREWMSNEEINAAGKGKKPPTPPKPKKTRAPGAGRRSR